MKAEKSNIGRSHNTFCAAALIVSVMAFSGCAYSMAEVKDIWTQVANEYPGCSKMPKIITFDEGIDGGFYVKGKHIVVIDKYASEEVWSHEFRHSCGDAMGEEPMALAGDNVYAWIKTFKEHSERFGN